MQQSFLLPSGNQQQMTPDQKRQALAQHFQQQIMSQPAQNVTQGAGQLAMGIGMGLKDYMAPQNQYPSAPGSSDAAPTMGGMNLASLFGFGNKGWSF